MKNLQSFCAILFLMLVHACTADAQALIDFETGAVFTGYNNVRIPGNQGTRFSLKDDLKPKTAFFYRLRLNYTLRRRHTFSLLYAPLQTQSKGRIANDVLFEGVVFPANTDLVGDFKFNSYRFTYRCDLVRRRKIVFGLGFTAKIRDARIALSAPGLFSEKTNVGFVPIINFSLLWNMTDKLGLLLDGDALAAPQGRAEDVLLALRYRLSDKIGIRAGYRILEGGADGASVYNFTLLHYASVGVAYTFNSKT